MQNVIKIKPANNANNGTIESKAEKMIEEKSEETTEQSIEEKNYLNITEKLDYLEKTNKQLINDKLAVLEEMEKFKVEKVNNPFKILN